MIRSAFAELLEERGEIEDITVSELAERADISKSTFYYHYEDIYAVAEEFENELLDMLSQMLDRMKSNPEVEYDVYIKSLVSFLKEHEDVYRKAVSSMSATLFVERLKSILSKKVFEESQILPFDKDTDVRYTQIRFLSNACVDTMADCFKGNLKLSLEQTSQVILEILKKLI
ncbi:MAG: TetR/AcrR family transcriptional regulator [Candidatus Gallimonas sp.]